MKKYVFFSVFLFCLTLTPLYAQAKDNAGEMRAGTWTVNPRYMTFGAYNGHLLLWRVLEVKDNDLDFGGIKTAFLLLDDLLRNNNGNVEVRIFDPVNNNFPVSEIKKWLNDSTSGFLTGFDAWQCDILDTTYGPDTPHQWTSPASCTSKVFILSVGEANNSSYFANDDDRVANSRWWLRSPGYGNDVATSVLGYGSVARNGPYVYGDCGVRPALKINLSPSSVFAALPVSYVSTVKVNDGSNPIPGAKAFFSEQYAEKFSNSDGIVRFSNVLPGAYTITISKPGYEKESRSIIVPGTPTISMKPDTTTLPAKVKFGKYNGNPIEWDVLDIVDGKALLFAEPLFQSNFDIRDETGSSVWANSSLCALLNSTDSEGFMQEWNFLNVGGFMKESNFTAAEASAIDSTASSTGDSVFLLSIEEVYKYLPDASMRYFDSKEWLTRTPGNSEDVMYISVDGEHGGGIPANTRNILCWVRPAMWVDLCKLTYDFTTGSLVFMP